MFRNGGISLKRRDCWHGFFAFCRISGLLFGGEKLVWQM